MAARYLDWQREAFDDGWAPDEATPPPATTVTIEHPRTIISRNESPDIPFEASINPYRGCEHGCVYCLSGDTPILMLDGTTRPLSDLRTGDQIYGTVRKGWYRRYAPARVLGHWSVIKPAYRITLEDGTKLVAGPDHRFLTERGWKFVLGTQQGRTRRPHLTAGNKMMGTGAFAAAMPKGPAYRLGYLCGVVRGDALLASFHYERRGRSHGDQHQFRLALCDAEALRRAEEYLHDCGIATYSFVFQAERARRRAMHGIRNHAQEGVDRVRRLIAWPADPSAEWYAGFLAGIFDAEGSFSQTVLRITNTDKEIIDWIVRGLKFFGFRPVIESPRKDVNKPVQSLRLLGGLPEQLRLFHLTDPAIARKRNIIGQAVKSPARLDIVRIEPISRAQRMYDIQTDTEDFIANGVVSHNCYARPTHAYMDLSPGIDFETKLFAKPDAAMLLKKELAQPGYRCTPIALGANTDPYQPIEREWKITRGIIEVLRAHDHPLTVVTKSWRVERDIDLLADMARRKLAQVFVSITSLDHDLARRLEPRAAAPRRRVECVRALSRAGIPVGVLFAPVIPFLNDAALEDVLAAAAEAGAGWAGYVIVRLPLEIKDLFEQWLEQHEPLKWRRVMNAIRELRGGRDNDPRFFSRQRGQGPFAEIVRSRFELACRRHGLNRGRLDLRTDLFHPPAPEKKQLELFR
ncbi:MAG: PA0069 family radical SAM protein [Gammaproteobacteria bacterium]|nr:PA0069 family radical SAM protein [Gammaproteobacteria bacterium]